MILELGVHNMLSPFCELYEQSIDSHFSSIFSVQQLL